MDKFFQIFLLYIFPIGLLLITYISYFLEVKKEGYADD